jgi:HSP20 family protein
MSSFMPSVMSSGREERLDRQIDRILDDALCAFGSSTDHWAPACNVWDDDGGFYVQMALPGWEASEIAPEVNHQMLTIRGERKGDSSETRRYHLQEFGGNRFVRAFKLPSFVDHEKGSAIHKNGLLTLSFPKREEAKSRRILIAAE